MLEFMKDVLEGGVDRPVDRVHGSGFEEQYILHSCSCPNSKCQQPLQPPPDQQTCRF